MNRRLCLGLLTVFFGIPLFFLNAPLVHAATLGTDTFTRTVSNGWGTATTGGTYTTVGTASNFSVTGTEGRITFTFAGVTREAYLGGISTTNTEISSKIKLSSVPTGGGYVVDLFGRRVDSSNSYRARAEFKSDGQVIVRGIAQNGGAEVTLASQTVSGLTYTANMEVTMKAQFIGTNPTTVRVKLWQSSQAEPGTWTVDTTDSTASIQTAGSAGVRATSSSDAGTLNVSFDDLNITDGNLVNVSPTVEAGIDQTISRPNAAVMAATVTDDNFSGRPLTLSWSKVSGPGTVTFSPSASTEDPSATFSQAGTYVLQLNANDTEFSVSDTLTVTVNANTTPTVDAGQDKTIALPSTSTMTATVSDNAPGSYTLAWSQDSGPATATFAPNDTVEDPVVTFPTSGTYVLRLTANDGEFTPSDTVTVTVNPNTAPTVDAGTNQTITLPNTAQMVATASDTSPSTLTLTWSKVTGPGTVTFTANANIEDPVVGFSEAGTYVLQLLGSDGVFETTDTVTITVNPRPSNVAPTVDAGLPQLITLPDSVFLNATISDDDQPNPYTISWSKVSGPGTVTFSSITSEDPQASFSKAGTYVLQVTANDTALSASDTVTITVNRDPSTPRYDDVPLSYLFYSYIENLSGLSIMNGYDDGTYFKPNQYITRGEMAKIIKNAFGLPTVTSCQKFTDVNPGQLFYTDITSLKCLGIITGFSDGTFRGDLQVSRVQAVKFVMQAVRVKQGNSNYLRYSGSAIRFSDIPTSHPFYEFVMSASEPGVGIVSGYGDNTFKPGDSITRGAMAKIVDIARAK